MKANKMKVIVVVDDDETIRKTFFLILNKQYRVYLAKDIREAIKRFKASNIDLLIVDLKLSKESGIDLISKFRKAGFAGKAILISAYPDQLRLENLEHLAISKFFTKPLDLDALDESIKILLSPSSNLMN